MYFKFEYPSLLKTNIVRYLRDDPGAVNASENSFSGKGIHM